MKILFCRVSWMKYYQGAGPEDTPINGGRYVNENGFGHEEYNFLPITVKDGENENGIIEPGDYHLGFVETMSTNGVNSNQLRFENIAGCEKLKNEPAVENVLVVWFATSDMNETNVVGWYRNATVFRYYQSFVLDFENGTSDDRWYNIFAKIADCTLLPHNERRSRSKWHIPNKKYTHSFGYGQSMLWYAGEGNQPVQSFLEKLITNINEYDGIQECNET